jgi:hypothetical protein
MNRNIEKASPQEVSVTKETNISRRDVLRGALVAGCSMFVPMAIFSSSASGAEPAAASGPKKQTQTAVGYTNHPKGGQKCHICANYIAESKTCKLVEGSINPEGWCILWAAKV